MRSFFTAYIFGLLASFFAVIVEIATSISPLALKLDSAHSVGLHTHYFLTVVGFLPLVFLASIEEGVRFVFLRQFILRFRIDSVITPFIEKVLLGIAFGLGFASLEIFLILGSKHIAPTVPLIGIALLHITMSTLFSFLLLRSPLPKLLPILLTLGLTLMLHTGYNLAVLLYS